MATKKTARRKGGRPTPAKKAAAKKAPARKAAARKTGARKSAAKKSARKARPIITRQDWMDLRTRLKEASVELGNGLQGVHDQATTQSLRRVKNMLDDLANTPPGTYPNVTDRPTS
jgi:hypothetical protein